jgi:hypothetical protein
MVVEFKVSGFIGLLNVANTGPPPSAPVDPSAGSVLARIGGTGGTACVAKERRSSDDPDPRGGRIPSPVEDRSASVKTTW